MRRKLSWFGVSLTFDLKLFPFFLQNPGYFPHSAGHYAPVELHPVFFHVLTAGKIFQSFDFAVLKGLDALEGTADERVLRDQGYFAFLILQEIVQ